MRDDRFDLPPDVPGPPPESAASFRRLDDERAPDDDENPTHAWSEVFSH